MGQFFTRLGEILPTEAERMKALAELYNETRYGPNLGVQQERRLRASLHNAFKYLKRYA